MSLVRVSKESDIATSWVTCHSYCIRYVLWPSQYCLSLKLLLNFIKKINKLDNELQNKVLTHKLNLMIAIWNFNEQKKVYDRLPSIFSGKATLGISYMSAAGCKLANFTNISGKFPNLEQISIKSLANCCHIYQVHLGRLLGKANKANFRQILDKFDANHEQISDK